MEDSEIPGPWLFRKWIVGGFVFLIILLGLGVISNTLSLSVNRLAIEQSVGYSQTNIDAFYVSLSAIKKIDVQLAALPEGSSQKEPLLSQRAFLEGELQRLVAKIPMGSRTPDMFPYGVSQ